MYRYYILLRRFLEKNLNGQTRGESNFFNIKSPLLNPNPKLRCLPHLNIIAKGCSAFFRIEQYGAVAEEAGRMTIPSSSALYLLCGADVL